VAADKCQNDRAGDDCAGPVAPNCHRDKGRTRKAFESQ
jgi:hypothetical protein